MGPVGFSPNSFAPMAITILVVLTGPKEAPPICVFPIAVTNLVVPIEPPNCILRRALSPWRPPNGSYQISRRNSARRALL